MQAVRTYEDFARHYDEVTGSDPLANGARVRGHLRRHAPGAVSLLELGCGSGQILAALTQVRVRSPASTARRRCSRGPGRACRAPG